MRFRQVHLDFHTSELIAGVGSRFDADAFAKAFADAHVDSVTVFSKCHHGMSYHPTKVGMMHPGLSFDLLRAQIDALHARGIKAPVYLSATWDEYAARTHPEWRTVSPEGCLPQTRNEPTGWAYLDYSSPYLDYLCAQVDEAMLRYPDGDGIFMDISFQLPSISVYARKMMEEAGLDWLSAADRGRHTARITEIYRERITDTVHKRNPNTPVFFNSGHIRRGSRADIKRFYSHLELESLPTAGWGYDHFPLSARYVDGLGIPFLGMTGKFHFTWGEVGGYKRPEALMYECGTMLAHGARCSVGDHLHPTGAIDPATMRVIAPAYAWVEQCEPFAVGTVNRAEIAVLSLEAMTLPPDFGQPERHSLADEGASRALLEAGFTFDLVDRDSDLAPYRLLILPDAVPVDAATKARIDAFVKAGGRVLFTGRSGIDEATGFQFDVGASWHGRSPMTGGDYLLPVPELQADGIDQPMFMYQPSEQITVTDGRSLGAVHQPYFDRTPKHFSGHIQAPVRPEPTAYAAGVEKGSFTYFAHPIFSCYQQVGAVRMLEIIEKLVERALRQPKMIETSLPRAGRVTLRAQTAENRDIVHLLYANPIIRGSLWDANIEPIQDVPTLHDTTITLEPRGKVRAVREAPSGRPLTFVETDGRVSFTLPAFTAVALIEVVYA